MAVYSRNQLYMQSCHAISHWVQPCWSQFKQTALQRRTGNGFQGSGRAPLSLVLGGACRNPEEKSQINWMFIVGFIGQGRDCGSGFAFSFVIRSIPRSVENVDKYCVNSMKPINKHQGGRK